MAAAAGAGGGRDYLLLQCDIEVSQGAGQDGPISIVHIAHLAEVSILTTPVQA